MSDGWALNYKIKYTDSSDPESISKEIIVFKSQKFSFSEYVPKMTGFDSALIEGSFRSRLCH